MGKAVGKITETGMPSGVGKSLCPENWFCQKSSSNMSKTLEV